MIHLRLALRVLARQHQKLQPYPLRNSVPCLKRSHFNPLPHPPPCKLDQPEHLPARQNKKLRRLYLSNQPPRRPHMVRTNHPTKATAPLPPPQEESPDPSQQLSRSLTAKSATPLHPLSRAPARRRRRGLNPRKPRTPDLHLVHQAPTQPRETLPLNCKERTSVAVLCDVLEFLFPLILLSILMAIRASHLCSRLFHNLNPWPTLFSSSMLIYRTS